MNLDDHRWFLSKEEADRVTVNFNTHTSDWVCYMCGDEKWSWQLRPSMGKEPNWFHRKMQELILGFKWRKLK